MARLLIYSIKFSYSEPGSSLQDPQIHKMDLNGCHHIQNHYFFLTTKLSFWIKFIMPASFS